MVKNNLLHQNLPNTILEIVRFTYNTDEVPKFKTRENIKKYGRPLYKMSEFAIKFETQCSSFNIKVGTVRWQNILWSKKPPSLLSYFLTHLQIWFYFYVS